MKRSMLAVLAAAFVGISAFETHRDVTKVCLVDPAGKCLLDKKKSKDPPKAEPTVDSKKEEKK
jgi:hypothetical protein